MLGFLCETKAKTKEKGQAVTDSPFALRKRAMGVITKLNGAEFGKYICSMAVHAELSYANGLKTWSFPSDRAGVLVGHRCESGT